MLPALAFDIPLGLRVGIADAVTLLSSWESGKVDEKARKRSSRMQTVARDAFKHDLDPDGAQEHKRNQDYIEALRRFDTAVQEGRLAGTKPFSLRDVDANAFMDKAIPIKLRSHAILGTVETRGIDRGLGEVEERSVQASALGTSPSPATSAARELTALAGHPNPTATAEQVVAQKAARILPEVEIKFTEAMAADPQVANTERYLIEWLQEGEEPLVRGGRQARDIALRRLARRQLRAQGIDIDRLDAMHPLDSALDPLVHLEPGRRAVYIFGNLSVNRSLGSQLGHELERVGINLGDQFRIVFRGFPSYEAAPPSLAKLPMWWQ